MGIKLRSPFTQTKPARAQTRRARPVSRRRITPPEKKTTYPYAGHTYSWQSRFDDWQINQGDGGRADYSRPVRNHPAVFRSVMVIAAAAGSADFKIARKVNGKVVPIETGVEYQTFRRPNSRMSTDMLMGQIAGWMQMAPGEAFLRVLSLESARRLVLISPAEVDNIRTGANGTLEYHYAPTKEWIPEEELIHIPQLFNPYDPLRGMGPLQAAAMAYQDDLDVRKYNRTVVRAGGMPAGFLGVKGGSWPTPEEQELFREELKKVQHQQQKVVLVGDGQWQTAGQTPEEMAFIELRKLSFKEIGGVFGVPPQMLGDYERDQADARVQMESFQLDTMRPLLRLIADVLTLNLWKIRGTKFEDDDMFCYFDDSKVPAIARMTAELAAADREDVKMGMGTINRVLERRGEESVPWGDVFWSNWGPVRGPELPELPGMNDDPEPDDDEDKPKKVWTAEKIMPADALEWHAFVLRTTGYELQIVSALGETWKKVEKQVIAELRKRHKDADLDELMNPDFEIKLDDESIRRPLFDIPEIAGDIAERTTPHLRAAQLAGGTRGLRLARVRGEQFRVNAKPVIEQLQAQVQRFAVPVTETTWQKLKDSLSKGLKNGESIEKLVARVEQTMDVRRVEAARTARTEVSAAMNGGVSLGFEQSEVVDTKRWVTAGDEHVRSAHRAANGQERSVVDAFNVGGEELEYPGDPHGSAQNVIECRCTLVPGRIRTR